jgi:hypothetical protein
MRDVNFCIVFVLTILYTFVAQYNSFSEETTPIYKNAIPSKISLFGGYAAGNRDEDFFKTYQIVLGGKADNLKYELIFGASLKLDVNQHMTYGISFSYLSSSFYDYFSQFVATDSVIQRYVTEDFYQSNIPLLLTAEYVAIRSQFRSYIGIGAGLNFDNTYWTETVNSSLPAEKRESGIVYDGNDISPTARLYVGTELEFDKKNESDMTGSIYFEIGYTHFFRNIPYFSNIEDQFTTGNDLLKEDYSISSGYFSFNIGFSIGFTTYTKF